MGVDSRGYIDYHDRPTESKPYIVIVDTTQEHPCSRLLLEVKIFPHFEQGQGN